VTLVFVKGRLAPDKVCLAGDCIALEDSNNGLRSSLAAGIKTYITINNYTRNQDFREAAAVFDDLGNLEAFYKVTGLPLTK
jgi:beta-phosphoglucomutase-like phosphatase (HAD superfamily)